jgi:hypothetical protein
MKKKAYALISLSNEVKKAQLFLCFMKLQRYEDE